MEPSHVTPMRPPWKLGDILNSAENVHVIAIWNSRHVMKAPIEWIPRHALGIRCGSDPLLLNVRGRAVDLIGNVLGSRKKYPRKNSLRSLGFNPVISFLFN